MKKILLFVLPSIIIMILYINLFGEIPTYTMTEVVIQGDFLLYTGDIETSPRFLVVRCGFVQYLQHEASTVESVCVFSEMPRQIDIWDLDGDGLVDFCYTDSYNNFHLLFSDSYYVDEWVSTVLPGLMLEVLRIDDLNGDTYPDLIIAAVDSMAPDSLKAQVWVDYGDAGGFDFTFERISMYLSVSSPSGLPIINDMEIGHLNGDAWNDIALAIAGGGGAYYYLVALLNGIPGFPQHNILNIAYNAIALGELYDAYPGRVQIAAMMSQMDIGYFDDYGAFTRAFRMVDWGSFHFNHDVKLADIDENSTNDVLTGGVNGTIDAVINVSHGESFYICTLAVIDETVKEICPLDDNATFVLVRDITGTLHLLEKVDEGIEEIRKPDDFEMTVYPNPFNGAISIKIAYVEALNATPVQVEIYDIKGEKIGWLDGGMNEWMGGSGSPDARITVFPSYTWSPAASIPSGIYLIKVTTGENSVSRKVLYLK